jgi:gluconokinase
MRNAELAFKTKISIIESIQINRSVCLLNRAGIIRLENVSGQRVTQPGRRGRYVIIVVMGVSGSGKSTVGRLLSEELGWQFYEGDDYHPPDNVRKMTQGIALSDADRAVWLGSLARLVSEFVRDGRSAVIACSALKQAYRDALIGKSTDVRFVYLKGNRDIIRERMDMRQGHYMKAGLLESQFAILEEPCEAVAADIAQPPELIVRMVKRALGL